MYHHQVIGQDAGVEHRLPPDPQGKELILLPAAIKGQIVVNALLGQDRRTRRHVAQDGDAVVFLRLLRSREDDGPALEVPLLDQALLLKPLQVKVDRRGRLQPHSLADLPHRGGVPLLRDHCLQILINPVCHLRLFWHDQSSQLCTSSSPRWQPSFVEGRSL